MCGTGGIGKSLYLPFSFVVNPKLLYKSKVLKKKKDLCIQLPMGQFHVVVSQTPKSVYVQN